MALAQADKLQGPSAISLIVFDVYKRHENVLDSKLHR